MYRLNVCTFLCFCISIATSAVAGTPHDPYIYWLPSGQTKASAYCTVKLRHTRFGLPDADLVLVRSTPKRGQLPTINVTIKGKNISRAWSGTYLVIPAKDFEGMQQVSLTFSTPTTCRFYLTRDFRDLSPSQIKEYDRVLRAQFSENWNEMLKAATSIASRNSNNALGRLARLKARHAKYRIRSQDKNISAHGRYLLGMYCMENGFWEDAVREFELATKLNPKHADAWYMLADARAYRDGDDGDKVAQLIPLYRRSAELRNRRPNYWNIYVGIFRKMWVEVDDGKGGRTKKLLEMSNENVERIKREWNWVSDMVWAASRGAMKFNNKIVVHNEEFDNSDPQAFDNLWKPGEQDVFMKFYEGGPSDAMGHDCGPNRTAIVNIGTWCGWEVYLHEWNHTLDWSMITSENGKGVPVTHSSDWCGFQPIPSMGRGHASCNHYYMTPGMFESVKGSEVKRLGYNTKWSIYGPYECEPNKGLDTPFLNESSMEFPKPATITLNNHAENGWIDLKKLLAPSSEAVVAYASAYVYSPKLQKVRMWLGMNDGIRVWLNGRLVHRGIYKAIALWEEANEPDQVVPTVVLQKGWNSFLVKVENLPRTQEDLKRIGVAENGWGFSVRLCGLQNEELAGVKWSAVRPADWKPPKVSPDPSDHKLYRWEQVAEDYTTWLPCLTEKDLEDYTGLHNIRISKDCLIICDSPHKGQKWISSYDENDRGLNNLLNWRFESAAVLRYTNKKKQTRDLVFLRPEAYETYISLMQTARGSEIKRHADRVLGYVLVSGLEDHPNGRIMLVLDTYLGKNLPIEDRDLLDLAKAR
jgi:hypothetical protein